ncbi:MAG: ABC transporter permease [Nitrososphaerota archaeon]|jgi:putative ABC transport system permease protein|nr:ABC transporter permease [Nitrososphaerota archaeon]
MKIYDIFGYSFNAIKLRKLRAGLTTLGVIIGITAIVALLSITQGLQANITDQFNQGLSANSLIIVPGGGDSSQGDGLNVGLGSGADSSGFNLYLNYTAEIENLSPDIDSALAIIQRSGYVETGSLSRRVTIYGVDFDTYSQVYSAFSVATGTIPINHQESTVVVGNRITDPRQNGSQFVVPGNDMNIFWLNATTLPPVNETYTAQVSGVLDAVGGFSIGGGPSDTGVYIPLSKAESFFGTDTCEMIIVTLVNSDKDTVANVENLIKEYFSGQVSVVSPTALQSVLKSIFDTIQLFLVGIAAISLLVAGVGIMNIMIVSLIERTREIGILKALGMKNRTVLAIFLGESVIIGLMGAIIGIICGWVLANITATVLASGVFGGGGNFAITPLLTLEVFLGALGFGVGVSVIFALYPAWRASKLKPVDALRYA